MADGSFWKTIGTAFKANPLGAIAGGASTAMNLGFGIYNSIKTAKLQKQWDRLNANRPTYEIPQSYKDALAIYQKQASQTQLPGQGLIEENIGQSSARARTAAERGAISSTSYGGQVSNIYDKELQAIQDLGIKSAEFQQQNQQNLATGMQMMGGQQEKAQDWNTLGKWSTQMNQLESKMGASSGAASNAWQGLSAGLTNFAGTSYYNQMLKQMQNQG
jgi:hypothetical protein